MKKNQFPPGWDEARVRKVLDAYESQSEDEAVAEDEAAFDTPGQTVIGVPSGIVPKVRQLIAEHKKSQSKSEQ
jgi:hypothetical protein